jgi:hypothetical protein
MPLHGHAPSMYEILRLLAVAATSRKVPPASSRCTHSFIDHLPGTLSPSRTADACNRVWGYDATFGRTMSGTVRSCSGRRGYR